MKKLIGAGLALWVAALTFAPSVHADSVQTQPKWRRWHVGRGQEACAAPELDPRASTQALALLAGGLALALDGSRRRRAAAK